MSSQPTEHERAAAAYAAAQAQRAANEAAAQLDRARLHVQAAAGARR